MANNNNILTPRERVFRRLQGETVDKIPNLNIIMTFAAKFIKVSYKKYVTDYRYLAEGNIACCEKFGIDMMSAISDPFREAHGFGENIIFPEDDVPICNDFLIKEYSDIDKLKINDPLSCERMLDRINAIKLYKKEIGKKFPILGWVEGAFAEAADLRGLNKLMFDIYDAPDFIKELLEICTKQAILFSIEQINAGADFIGIGDAAASLVGPYIYKDFVLPYEQRIIDAVHKKGAKIKLHICGNISSILDLLPLTGADIVDVDWMVNFKIANEIFKDKCCACGNFDPVRVLLQGSTYDVERAVTSCINEGNSTTFIAAGCEVPKMTPFKNLIKVDSTIKEMMV
ncbi:MAG: uroporphyrinogen decarboxylase family protein [Candidatus Humimicrobiaceae bacterium]